MIPVDLTKKQRDVIAPMLVQYMPWLGFDGKDLFVPEDQVSAFIETVNSYQFSGFVGEYLHIDFKSRSKILESVWNIKDKLVVAQAVGSMPEGEYLSKEDVIAFAEELSIKSARPILDILSRNPWLVDLSRQYLHDLFGKRLVVYRAIMKSTSPRDGSDLGPDEVASASTNPLAIINLVQYLGGSRLDLWSGKVTSPTFYLRRYDVPVFRALAYIPAIIDDIRHTYGQALSKWKIHGEGKHTVSYVFREYEHEEEVVCDFTGIAPTMQAAFDHNDSHRLERAMMGDPADIYGRDRTPFTAEYLDWVSRFVAGSTFTTREDYRPE
jgi:hypothetical protein